MKKRVLILSLVFIFSTVYLDAYVNKRYIWWNLRIKRLEKLLVSVKNSRSADNRIKSLIMNDIKTGRDFISFHNRKIFQNLENVKDPGSMTQLSIKKEIVKRIYPVAAFLELEELLRNAGSSETAHKVKKSVWNEIEKILKEQAGISNKNLVDFIGSCLVQKNELKMLSMEIILFTHLHNVEMRIEKTVETLAGTAMFNIKNRREGLDPAEFSMRITEWAIETCSAAVGKSSGNDLKDALGRSRRWQFIRKKLLKLTEKNKEGLSAIENYRKRPAGLVKRIKRINGELQHAGITDSILLLKDNRVYLERIAKLLKRTASAGIYAYPYLEGRIKGAHSRICDIYRYLVSLRGIKMEKMRGAPGELPDQYRTGKKQYSEDLKKIKKRIDKNYRLIYGRISVYRGKVKKLGKSIRKQTAEYELSLIISLIEDYSKAFRKYNYESEILNIYSAEFKRVIKQLESKEYQRDLAQFNHKFSLLKNIGFNSERLQREKLNKEIIRKEGLRLISSLSYLMNYHKRKSTDLNYYPASSYILQLKKRFKGKSGIKIGSWTMTSDNYSVIDRNVSALLKKIVSRNVWLEAGRKKDDGETGSPCSVEMGGVRFSLNIPHGWFEESLTESDRSRGIIKKFISIDKRSSIKLAGIQSGKRKGIDIKETGEKWARTKGMKPVMKKWGKKESLDYYWVLSRDSSGAVNETYTLKRDDYTFILSGETDSARYRFFRIRLESVFDSILF
jgi:hypothetical protein